VYIYIYIYIYIYMHTHIYTHTHTHTQMRQLRDETFEVTRASISRGVTDHEAQKAVRFVCVFHRMHTVP